MKIFVHGVPDTPAMWEPLLGELGKDAGETLCPALPGFSVPVPDGFDCTKEAYADWLVDIIEAEHARHGEVDLVGHDWGALLVVRAACLRPHLVRSWAVSNALPEQDYKWHRTARIFQTPLLGELFMALTSRKRLTEAFVQSGVPREIGEIEAQHWDRSMKSSILKLYRSAKHVAPEWAKDLARLPDRGMVFWGDDDPFVSVETAERFCQQTKVPLHRLGNTGHWSVVERAGEFASLLRSHWA